MPEERPHRTPSRSGRERRKGTAGGMQLLAVQSVACVVVVLIALLMRLIGGLSLIHILWKARTFTTSFPAGRTGTSISALRCV